jgi:23S rRNA (cytidine1920-2'-O)/16S rRNA (cytidine1409-2'-O)-methyltransferase
MPVRLRADRLLVERGLFESRAKAQAAIAAGLVTADGRRIAKSSDEIAADASVTASPEHPYVSRGGIKLAAALDHFAIDPHGCVCLDVGASTGGFTQVLLTRGAERVYAVDVGHDQLHATLREHPAVVSLEGVDIRKLDASLFERSAEIVTIDVSFISLKLVLPAVTRLVAERAALVALVALIKPQFEAGRGALKKGIVRDPTIHADLCRDIADKAAALGWHVEGVIASPIAGGDGNREFLLGARRG